jgi:hypothetical protein
VKKNAMLERLAALSPEEQEETARLLEIDLLEFKAMIGQGIKRQRGMEMPGDLLGVVNKLRTSLDAIAASVPPGFELVISSQGTTYRKRPGRRPAGMPPAEEMVRDEPKEEAKEVPVAVQFAPKPRALRGRNR